jgi:hypothetical protein
MSFSWFLRLEQWLIRGGYGSIHERSREGRSARGHIIFVEGIFRLCARDVSLAILSLTLMGKRNRRV